LLTIEDAPSAIRTAREWLTQERVNDLIMVHYPLAVGMARKFARKREVQPDDYIGVAGLSVTIAINNALKYLVDEEGITKYVVTYVRSRLMKHYQEDKVVATPARRQQEFFALGYVTPIVCRPLTDDDINTSWDSRIMQDLEDILPDEFTRKIAHLRVEGYTNTEIAVLLNVSYKTVRTAYYKLCRLVKQELLGVEEDVNEQPASEL
jgi:RNA polymerase sigma factor (sigma-70 family)